MSSTFSSNAKAVAISLGKLWIVVTAVIGSLIVVAFLSLVVMFSRGKSELGSPAPLSQKVLKKGGKEKIAIVRLEGEISESDSPASLTGGGSTVSSTAINKILDGIAEEDDVKAVVLRINSPGGAVVASDEIYRRVRELQKKKIVIASLGDTAASGGYYIASATNTIVANPASITGSIGVIAHFPKLSGLYEKVGFEMRTIKSGEFKDIGSESRDLTPAEQQILQGLIMNDYDQFVSAVATGRKMDEAKVRMLADGRVYSGRQAKENGLVDELGDLNDAVMLAGKTANVTNPTLVEFTDKSFFEALFSSSAKKLSFGADLSQLFPEKFGVYYMWSP